MAHCSVLGKWLLGHDNKYIQKINWCLFESRKSKLAVYFVCSVKGFVLIKFCDMPCNWWLYDTMPSTVLYYNYVVGQNKIQVKMIST